jgi:Cof subfamily protein (haloacid dehalogenase superfamily)
MGENTGRVQHVFTDVDGTLIGSSGEASARVWDAARRLRDRGIPISICSGRPAVGIALAYGERLGPGAFHSFQNGASILHLGTGESISQTMRPETVARLEARQAKSGQLLELYSDTEYAFAGPENHAIAHTRLLGIPFHRSPFSALKNPVVRAQWIVPHADAPALGADLSDDFPELEVTQSTSPLMPDIHFVMLTLRGVNKASAVELICARQGISLQQAMFVGDGDNDVAPMRRVGSPVAMGNASEKCKAAAREHVGDVEDGALADALLLALRE